MAKMTTIRPGFTRYTNPENAPSVLVLQDSAGNEYALWFDTAGTPRRAAINVAEAPGFNWNTGGVPVASGSFVPNPLREKKDPPKEDKVEDKDQQEIQARAERPGPDTEVVQNKPEEKGMIEANQNTREPIVQEPTPGDVAVQKGKDAQAEKDKKTAAEQAKAKNK